MVVVPNINELSLNQLIALSDIDLTGAKLAARSLIVPYSGNAKDLESYYHEGNPKLEQTGSENLARLEGFVDFRFDPTWWFFLRIGGVSVMRGGIQYPQSWHNYCGGYSTLKKNIIGNRSANITYVMVGKMPDAEDIRKLNIGRRKSPELQKGEFEQIRDQGYIYVEAPDSRPGLRTRILLDIPICESSPLVISLRQYSSIMDGTDRKAVSILLPESLHYQTIFLKKV